jgi:hypothetical protein
MRKLKLDPETLRVESFAPSAGEADRRGTVRGLSYVTFEPQNACGSDASVNCQPTDVHLDTCGNSCINMCLWTDPAQTCVE